MPENGDLLVRQCPFGAILVVSETVVLFFDMPFDIIFLAVLSASTARVEKLGVESLDGAV